MFLHKNERPYLKKNVYEEVSLPNEYFTHTSVILANKSTQGLLHSFVRHHNEWQDVIPGLSDLQNQFPSEISKVLLEIKEAPFESISDRQTMEKLHFKLNDAIIKAPTSSGNKFYIYVSYLIFNLL